MICSMGNQAWVEEDNVFWKYPPDIFQVFFCFLQHGGNAASYNIAEQYVAAFQNLAKSSNTILLPSDTGDVTSMVASVSSQRYSRRKWLAWQVLL